MTQMHQSVYTGYYGCRIIGDFFLTFCIYIFSVIGYLYSEKYFFLYFS